MANHKFWRIFISRNNGNAYTTLSEVQMRASVGGADQCTGGYASCSGMGDPTWNADKVFDDNGSTFWAQQVKTGAWIQYEFASPVDVVEYTLSPTPDGSSLAQSPKSWTLEFSDDGINWGFADARTGQTGWTLGEVRAFTVSQPATIVRLEMFAANGGTVLEMTEVEFRATIGGADQCTGGQAAASSAYDTNFDPGAAFDNNNSTLWASPDNVNTNQWLQYMFPSTTTVAEYALTARASFVTQMPKNWRLRISNDKGLTWTDLDERWNQSFNNAGETKVYATGTASPATAQLSQVVAEVIRPNVATANNRRPVVFTMT